MLRIGCLGAARIAPAALTKPCAAPGSGAVCQAVAARDPARARAFASKHSIPVVHDNYDALLADDTVDAIYNPLPNGLHALWTIKALEAGKHVLCEKPFTANTEEATKVAEAAEASGLVVMEAFHWRYHPLAARVLEIIASGELGDVQHVEASLCFPLPRFKDIRWDPALAGGSLMDAGCYPVHMVRTFAGAVGGASEPTVSQAVAKLHSPGIDRFIRADFTFPGGRTGRITTGMWSAHVLDLRARVVGSKGTLKVFNPTAPHLFNRLSIKGETSRRERVRGGPTYNYQLTAFVAAVEKGEPTLTPPAESIRNMQAIDAIYRAAGLEPRTGAVA